MVAARPTVSRWRVFTLLLVLALLTSAFGWRLADLQLSPDAALAADIGSQVREETIAAPRGDIVDRHGRTIAVSLPRPSIVANPQILQAEDVKAADRDLLGEAVHDLSALLSTHPEILRERLSSDKYFRYLERQVDPDVGEAVRALQIPGVYIDEEQRREHPNGDCSGLAVAGRVDVDQNGVSGLELDYDEHLTGEEGTVVRQTQGGGAVEIPGGSQIIEPMTPGEDLVLTIDRNVQFEAEQLLIEAVDASGGDHGIVILADPNRSEIIAMANVVRDPETGTARCTTTNLAATWTYEPGSIMKPFTFTSAFENDAWPETNAFDIEKVISIQLEDDKVHRYEDYALSRSVESHTPQWVLKVSSNNGTMTMAKAVGADALYDTMTGFGLGEVTSLELNGEASGILDSLDSHALELSNASIGQSVAVTPLQMLLAYNTLATGGVRMDPSLVLAEAGLGEAQRVVSEETASTVVDMMRFVVLDGTGKRADIDGYTVAGKTGTAWQPCGIGYDCDGLGTRHLTASFAGVVSNDHGAQLTAIVVIDRLEDPTAGGGSVAAPVFADIMSYALRQLRIPPLVHGVVPEDRVRAAAASVPSADPEANAIEGP
ncbi:MAG: penicillin-binding protein 2 [Acidimicrobiales bacterium]|nr:penicillin-binding protein 2 [Acidimicrobiales bacterium]